MTETDLVASHEAGGAVASRAWLAFGSPHRWLAQSLDPGPRDPSPRDPERPRGTWLAALR
ncbi:MAG: hypothetical protein Q8R91_06410 [Candidatus Omnitrophota bacterium]|nr:hypothetical protein [Candidatus Omnitrophota bacterium]